MAKWITVAIVAALFFSAGLFAGHSVPFTKALATAPTAKINSGPASAVQKTTSEVTMESSVPNDANPASFVSHAAPVDSAEFRTAEMIEESTAGREHRAAIQNLIRQHFPDMDADVAEIWVETYAEMSLDEIIFILQQKRSASNEIGTGASLPDLLVTELLASNPEQTVDVAVRMVKSNLQSAYALGFRRMVVLPEAISDPESLTDEEKRCTPTTSFRSFESGPLVRSPIATHVALTKESSVMFLLEGNRLTRRGDFRLLKDRRLGVVSRCGEMASAESTPIPEDATEVQIAADGTIHFENATGETGQAGRIAVCSVTDLENLQSDDGVFFTVSDHGAVTMREDAADFLLTNTLEQANVDRSYENSLLAHLKLLSDPSL